MFQQDHNNIDHRINLLNKADNQYPRGKKIFKISKFIIYLLIVLVVAFSVFSYQVIFTDSSLTDVFANKVNIFKQLGAIVGFGHSLRGESDDRINVALLGVGGAGHDGPDLTDTIIVVSVKPSAKQIAMFSVPRDLLVNIPGDGWRKINEANAYGEASDPGSGGELARAVLQNTLNIPIHYYVRVDFVGFEEIIDELGGVKIKVERGFTDYQYPTDDFKYQTVSFQPGVQTLDGAVALKYARSRHGDNGEGSDFARSRRQQQVMQAVKDRVMSLNFFLNPAKITKVANKLSTRLRTDLQPWEMLALAEIVENIDVKQAKTKIFDDCPGGMLRASATSEGYYLEPAGGNFSQIQYFVENIFSGVSETLRENKIVKLEIRNGTEINGLASAAAAELKRFGYQIDKVGNAPAQNYSQTMIYKLYAKDMPEASEFLQKKYNAQIISEQIPEWIKEEAAPDLDYLIILGEDASLNG
ncbi:MAG: LCP family protein [Parcubacteria group bacterium]